LILVHGGLPEGAAAWHSDEPVTPVSHITFDGITFSTGRFLHWEDDDPVAQHGWATCDKSNALLRFRGVEHCAVRNCTFTKSGGVGVRFDLYAQRNSVEGCTFHDLGMEAIHFGGYGAGTRDENHHNVIADNVIGFPGRIKTDARIRPYCLPAPGFVCLSGTWTTAFRGGTSSTCRRARGPCTVGTRFRRSRASR
jgi:hypothetical protein